MKTTLRRWCLSRQQLFNEVERELKLTGFWESIPARNNSRRRYKERCFSRSTPRYRGLVKNRAQIISRMMEIAEKNHDAILWAANELEYKVVRSAKRRKLTITVERDRAIVIHGASGNL